MFKILVLKKLMMVMVIIISSARSNNIIKKYDSCKTNHNNCVTDNYTMLIIQQ